MTRTEFTPPEPTPPSQKVTQEVARATDTDPLELEPLFETVDPESLNALFASTNNASRADGRVAFEYEGCAVSVQADGDVHVTDTPSRSVSQAELSGGE